MFSVVVHYDLQVSCLRISNRTLYPIYNLTNLFLMATRIRVDAPFIYECSRNTIKDLRSLVGFESAEETSNLTREN